MIEIANLQLDQFVWIDEFDYSLVTEQTERALNGAPHIEKAIAPSGRPITLQSAMEPKAVFTALFSHAQTTLTQFAITVRGNEYTVIWDHTQKPVTGTPIISFSDVEPDNFEHVTLRMKTL
ncbi:hypothetical protein [Pseudoalteromonas xiamenensis]